MNERFPSDTEKSEASVPDVPSGARAPFFLVMQFFLVPLGVVAACVAVFVLFGLMASDDRSPQAYLHDITGSDFNRRWQAAFELSRLVARDPKAAREAGLAKELLAVFQTAKGDPDPRVRRYVALTLGRMKSAAAGGALAEALKDADSETALFSAWALGSLGDQAAVPPLVEALRHPDAGVRKIAAYALGALGDARAADALAERLDDAAEDVRWNAAVALAGLHDDRGVAVLQRMLNLDYLNRIPAITEAQKTEARIGAARALGTLRHLPSLPLLRAMRESDSDLTVRSAASEAVEAMGGAAEDQSAGKPASVAR